MTSRDPLDYGWWLASRSAGIVAYLLLSAAVIAGLAIALRLGSPRARRALRGLHEQLALLALGATAAHGLFLLADPWLKPGLSGLLIPFASSYRPFWTGIGVLAAYVAAALSLTYYARRLIGTRRWRLAHRFIPVAWAMAAVHVIGSGTDAGSLWLQLPVALTAALVLALLGPRVAVLRRGRARPGVAPSPPAPSPAAAAAPAAAPFGAAASSTAAPRAAAPRSAAPSAAVGEPSPVPLWSRAAAADRGDGAETRQASLAHPPSTA